jgi:hypothetical protein
MLSDIHQHPQLLEWRRQAEAAWREPSHPGWQVLQEEIVSGRLCMMHCGTALHCTAVSWTPLHCTALQRVQAWMCRGACLH